MGKSSKDKRDIYYRLAKERGYRARSAFKLIHLHEMYGLFTPDTKRVIDLCAAPGSWSQVIVAYHNQMFAEHSAGLVSHSQTPPVSELVDSRTLASSSSVSGAEENGMRDSTKTVTRDDYVLISIDLQSISPLEYTHILKADLTLPSTRTHIQSLLAGQDADLVVCDGAPDVTGIHDLDIFLHHQLLLAALDLVRRTVRVGGTFVAKVFLHPLPPVVPIHPSRDSHSTTSPHFDAADVSTFIDTQLSSEMTPEPLLSASTRTSTGTPPDTEYKETRKKVHGGIDRRGEADRTLLRTLCEPLFEDTTFFKPPSSRDSSLEHFLVCRGFRAAARLPRTGGANAGADAGATFDTSDLESSQEAPQLARYDDFFAVGDLSCFNSSTPTRATPHHQEHRHHSDLNDGNIDASHCVQADQTRGQCESEGHRHDDGSGSSNDLIAQMKTLHVVP